MSDNKVYYPETIEETPFPQEEGLVSFSSEEVKSGDNYGNQQIQPQKLPTKKVSFELIASSLNTKSRKILGEFEFTQTGALQIGKYENGVSGDLKLSPSGIVARNTSGSTTFAIDGETGDATFAGTIQTGTLISGIVVVGDNSVIIDGANKYILISDIILMGYQSGGF